MKFQLASDLHLEFLANRWPAERLIQPVADADVLVLAGDIGIGIAGLQHFADWPVPIIYLAGNHEYYDHTLPDMREKLRRECKRLGIIFLENSAITMGDTRILGATLWTDYRLPRHNRTQSQFMEEAAMRINDHFLIRWGRNTFTPADALKLHEESRYWLERELVKPWTGKTVVITHHAPHPLSIHPRFIGNTVNASFVSDLSDLLPNVDLWLHGHVHDSFDYQVGRCRVVANPAGYIVNRSWAKDVREFQFENKIWDPQLLVQVSE